MNLANLSVNEFIKVTASKEPVPGGGSISALCAALSAALSEMVAGLTIGRKKYVEVEEEMTRLKAYFEEKQGVLIKCIDEDSDAYNEVFAAFKLPKETEEEQTIRAEKIQTATKYAAEVPLKVAQTAYEMMESIMTIAEKGNQNAVTDACVAMMCARTAVLGALLNVRINLSSINDTDYVAKMVETCNALEANALQTEGKLLTWIKTVL
ncbi:cyclodeaminase/cyclohydrolase family protein [Bacteroidales bacterium OttesenSCG-928-I14]|nr:cyclodeaminase/cyclohydrolase family protein [Bacteroidales bacterium OttesenSCG-928-I14]